MREKHEAVIQSWRGAVMFSLRIRLLPHSPDVILVGEDNDHSGVWVLTQPTNDLVKLAGFGLSGYFHRLGNAQTTLI